MSKIPENSEYKISPTFQNRLIELIDEQDCSRYEFASSAGISKGALGRATIYGIVPSVRTLIKIADFLNVSLDYLLGNIDNDDFYKSEQPTTFQIRLKELCAEKNVTYSKAAHAMPCSRNYFFNWQSNNTLPSLDYLIVLAEYFNVSMDYLLGRTDERHN